MDSSNNPKNQGDQKYYGHSNGYLDSIAAGETIETMLPCDAPPWMTASYVARVVLLNKKDSLTRFKRPAVGDYFLCNHFGRIVKFENDKELTEYPTHNESHHVHGWNGCDVYIPPPKILEGIVAELVARKRGYSPGD